MTTKFWVNSLKYHLLLRSWQIGTNQFKTPINTSSPPILGTNHMITKTWMRYRSFFICLVETFANWFYLMWWEFYAADMCSFAVVLFNLSQEWYECTSYIAGYYTNSSSTICWEKPVWWSNKPILAKKYWPHGLGEVCIERCGEMRGEIVTLLNLRDLTLVHRYATPTNAVGAGES